MRGWAEWCEPFGEGLWHPVTISHRSGRTGTGASRAGLPAHRHFVWRSRPRCERRDGRTWWLRYIDARNVDCRSLIIVMQDSFNFYHVLTFSCQKKGCQVFQCFKHFQSECCETAKHLRLCLYILRRFTVSSGFDMDACFARKVKLANFSLKGKTKKCEFVPHTNDDATMPQVELLRHWLPRLICWLRERDTNRIHMKSKWNPYEIHATISTILISCYLISSGNFKHWCQCASCRDMLIWSLKGFKFIDNINIVIDIRYDIAT